MKHLKLKLLALFVAALSLQTVATGTLAYFTATETAHNVITTGGIKIDLIEKTIDPDGDVVDFPEEGIPGVMPGTSASKIVSVLNEADSSDAWIRVIVEPTITGADGNPLPTVLEGGIPAVTIVIQSEKWIVGEDGYYYYTEPVKPVETTEVLFSEVAFAPQMGNEYQSCKVELAVSAQAVQVANNPIPEGGDVTDVAGWPNVGE